MKLMDKKRIGRPLTEQEKNNFKRAINITKRHLINPKNTLHYCEYESIARTSNDKSIINNEFPLFIDFGYEAKVKDNVKFKTILVSRFEVFQNVLVLGSLINKSKDAELSYEFLQAFKESFSEIINMKLFEDIIWQSKDINIIKKCIKIDDSFSLKIENTIKPFSEEEKKNLIKDMQKARNKMNKLNLFDHFYQFSDGFEHDEKNKYYKNYREIMSIGNKIYKAKDAELSYEYIKTFYSIKKYDYIKFELFENIILESKDKDLKRKYVNEFEPYNAYKVEEQLEK